MKNMQLAGAVLLIGSFVVGVWLGVQGWLGTDLGGRPPNRALGNSPLIIYIGGVEAQWNLPLVALLAVLAVAGVVCLVLPVFRQR